uniref:Synaptotagmin-like 2 n=1 Tax=Nothobranchius korthausae TaxID=1143690 RepID=A0A1A8FA86_9TELE
MKEHQLVNRQVISTVNSHQQEEHLMTHSTQINNNDSDHLTSPHTPEIIHRKHLNVETLNTARQSSSDRTITDHKNASLFKPKLQSDSDSESKESLLRSDTRSVPQLDPETRVRMESEMLGLSKNIPYMDYKQDYRHYLGMMEPTSVHTTLAPVVKDEGSEVKPGYELDLSGPVRASTPVSSEERYNRKNSFLGEVDVDLSKWDFDHTQMNYLALKARTLPSIAPLNGGRGEMRLAIRFLPQITHSEGLTKDVASTGEIHIWVKECKNLPLIRATIDPYVKCFVLPDTSRKSRQKTRVLRRTVEPVFNHTMVYDGISEADLSDACVELTVWDRDRLASNLLGGLRLGAGTGKSYGALVEWMDSGPYEVALWERMIASPNEWVEDVLPLRMLNSAKTAFK